MVTTTRPDSGLGSPNVQLANNGIPARFSKAGMGNLDKLAETATQDALEAEQLQTSLVAGTGVPGSDRLLFMWANRFDEVRRVSLKCDPQSTPTGEQLAKFLSIIPRIIQGKGQNDAISYNYLKDAIYWIKAWCQFRFKDFNLSAHDSSRLDATLLTLLERGVLTKQPVRDKQWITSDVIHILSKAMMRDGLANGTISWDALIMKVLSLVLQAALVSRAGDIRRSTGYSELECLCWEHISVKSERVGGRDVFNAVIELKFTKGLKDEPEISLTHAFTELLDPTMNCLCPIKLLLIYALRIGAVLETSWCQLRQAAVTGRQIIWAYPKRPVICSMGGVSKKLDLDIPSPVGAAVMTLKEGARIAGLLTQVIPHDIRRGGAREVALQAAARVMGHSQSTLRARITEDYVGELELDSWRARLEAPGARKHKLEFSEQPYKKRTLTASQTNQACQEHALDPTKPSDRLKAQRILHKEAEQAWRESQMEHAQATSSRILGRPAVKPQANDNEVGEIGCLPVLLAVDEHVYGSGPVEPVNEGLLGFLYNGTGSAQEDRELAKAMALGDQEEHVSATDSYEAILNSEPNAFALHFSRVNDFTTTQATDAIPSCAETGGSRAPPTRRMWPCTVNFCDREFPVRSRRDIHSQTCRADVKQTFTLVCEDCGQRYATEKQLRAHIVECTWQPRQCEWPNCEDETVYQSRDALRIHRNEIHHKRPNTCPGTDCAQTFIRTHSLKQHIQSFHPEITKSELDALIPILKRQAIKKNAFKSQPCSFLGCSHPVIFSSRSQYRDHLKIHGVRGDTLEQYIQDDPPVFRPSTPPRQRAKNYRPQRCSHPDCLCIQKFGQRHKLVAHLREAHGVSTDDKILILVMGPDELNSDED